MERKKPSRKTTPAKKRVTKTKKSPAKRGRKTTARASAARVKKAKAPVPTLRRAIFIDVENTSGEADLLKVLDHLQIDRKAQPTELVALGNWRSIGARVARMLAGLGAHLVHSAPAVGVRDWSDLWIAVAAGRWLATAAPGDTLEIVSDDRAFDAVGDAAAAAGVVFKRLSYRTIPSVAPAAASSEPHARRRRGSRRRRRGPTPPEAVKSSETQPAPPETHATEDEAHAASQLQIRAALARLSANTTNWVNLDTLANTLRTEGFVRPPGSARLITRLRRMKDVEVTPNGMVRLHAEALSTATPAAATDIPRAAPAGELDVPAPPSAPRPKSRRRAGRRRTSGASGAADSTETQAPETPGNA